MATFIFSILFQAIQVMMPSEAVEMFLRQAIYTSIDVVSVLHGKPEYAAILRRICWRESRCKPLRMHAIDRDHSVSVWRYAVRRRRLRPQTCFFHRNPQQWSTSGPFGLMRGYHWQFLGNPCLPPGVLDIPLVSAYVAYQKLSKGCKDACTYAKSIRVWSRSRRDE